jgi:hypothetical protein
MKGERKLPTVALLLLYNVVVLSYTLAFRLLITLLIIEKREKREERGERRDERRETRDERRETRDVRGKRRKAKGLRVGDIHSATGTGLEGQI